MEPTLIVGFAEMELGYIWRQATPEAKAIIIFLVCFSVLAWSIIASKAIQMKRGKKLNRLFSEAYQKQNNVLQIYNNNIEVDGCPLYTVYRQGCQILDSRLKSNPHSRNGYISLKSMEHVKRALEAAVAQEALKLESGLIFLAIAVSGAPFLGLLGTVWGVMSTFAHVGMAGEATLTAMAPGVAAALITTVAGLLVAIPSMFGYNWLVHNLRVMTVELDNFAQDLASKMEAEYLKDE
ncbi:MAG: MotA/TolQ/ExbB proton channel family protein [Verrucomicrobiia bacterium]